MEFVLRHIDMFHLRVRNFSSYGVLASIQLAGYRQACRGSGPRDQSDNGLVVRQWFAAPICADEGEQPMLHLIPLARARRKVAYRDRETQLIS